MGQLSIDQKIFRKIYRLKKHHNQIFENLVGGPSLPGGPKI